MFNWGQQKVSSFHLQCNCLFSYEVSNRIKTILSFQLFCLVQISKTQNYGIVFFMHTHPIYLGNSDVVFMPCLNHSTVMFVLWLSIVLQSTDKWCSVTTNRVRGILENSSVGQPGVYDTYLVVHYENILSACYLIYLACSCILVIASEEGR